MTTPTVTSLILAAGLGKRMRSKRAKVLHPVAGRPMIMYAVEAAERLPSKRIWVVVGHQAEAVEAALSGRPVRFIRQDRPMGTGHAVLQAEKALSDEKGPVLILNGDVPLISVETLRSMLEIHTRRRAEATLLTARLSDPTGYGRILRNSEGAVAGIVEEADAGPGQKDIGEINTGFYIVNAPFLFSALKELKTENAQKEYYLTDLVAAAVRRGLRLESVEAPVPEEIMGINSRSDLARTEKAVRAEILRRHMDEGVSIPDPDTVWIDHEVVVGRDSVIHPFVRLEGNTRIGEDCEIRSFSRITDCRISDGVTVRESCILSESVLEDGATVGPFAHLRPGTILHKKAKIGNFVETKKAEVGEGSKANHLTYLGDTRIGKRVNIGAGTITCNYDGVHKHPTVIEDDVFVGSDTQFIAPVRIGRGAVIGAGSTITKDVPPDALGLSRSPQVNRKNWKKKRKQK